MGLFGPKVRPTPEFFERDAVAIISLEAEAAFSGDVGTWDSGVKTSSERTEFSNVRGLETSTQAVFASEAGVKVESHPVLKDRFSICVLRITRSRASATIAEEIAYREDDFAV